MHIDDSKLSLILLSFEGPDLYARIGGLAVRVIELGRAFAQLGATVDTFFISDQKEPEFVLDGVCYHRCCTDISLERGLGVYSDEARKVLAFREEVIPKVEALIEKALEEGRLPVVLGEDWQTVGSLIGLSKRLEERSFLDRALLLWNANNTFGFGGIDFEVLGEKVGIITISRYMKEVMKKHCESPVYVVPNGVSEKWFLQEDEERLPLKGTALVTKVGRYHPDKRWKSALGAIASLKKEGYSVKLILRGGKESDYRKELMEHAESLGLCWHVHQEKIQDLCDWRSFLSRVDEIDCDCLELGFFIPDEFLKVLYGCSKAVLANSYHEPFGLVGLEVMASEGIAVVGMSGEDYAWQGVNALCVDSDSPEELKVVLQEVLDQPSLGESLRERALETARGYSWTRTAQLLGQKILFVASSRGVHVP